ncbi:MAG: RecQ family ATP-dependent DNA helicase [Clostridiales bacterium]|nr:RecQ family ATP-dependent DNA helicase [Clostridiales bacterium]
MDKLETLRRYFGHESFRAGQETMVDALLSGRDALGVMPTGAGKSMCYQVPALMLPGITLVISPLISLMADQVAALRSAGIPAAYLNSTLTPRQMDLALERAYQGAYKIIYVAPERLETPSFLRFAQHAQISLLAVDEAHCVSQWGQDFRPVYLRIADFVDMLPRRPVMGAFTATATQRVREDIVRHLRLVSPATVTTGFDRPNLYFEVVRVKKRDPALLRVLAGKQGQSGIVYCATRKSVEEVCDKLCGAGYAAGRYHAGLSDEERKQNQEDFQYDRVQIMVATNAFGMGIDKSNVRFVIHYNMPKSMEAYYQEAGRAGRDGEPSECVLLYNAQDIITGRWMINNSPPNEALSAAEQARVRQLDLQRLQSMIDYCTRDRCLRTCILNYFGDRTEGDCGDCGHCTGGRYGESAAAASGRKTPRRAVEDKPAVTGRIEGAGDLFEQLRAVRMALAKKQHVPPYVICSDATLNSMCRVKPQTKAGMLSVSGMGEIKTQRYGEAFLQVIREHEAAARKTRQQVSALARQSQMVYSRSGAKPGSGQPAVARVVRIIEPPKSAPLPPPRPPMEDDDDEALADAYLSGVSIQEMADELGVHPAEIRRRLQEMDLIF